jgi:RNA polymerase sigma factor (sigma-70 family)
MMGPDVLTRLLDEHAAALVLYSRQWCAAAEDVVQEAFVKLAAQKQLPPSPVAWLYRVVRNAALTAARAERRRRHHEAVAAGRAEPWLEACDPTGLDADAATAALRQLPAEQREVIVAHLWGRLTFEQIGAVVGCSSSTAHRWYLAGLAALRDKLGVPCPKLSRTQNSPAWKQP